MDDDHGITGVVLAGEHVFELEPADTLIEFRYEAGEFLGK
jgi:hypothetical protein